MTNEIIPPSTPGESGMDGERDVFIQYSASSGPLPTPSDLAKYAEISPVVLEAIVKMASDEGEHRREQDRFALSTEGKLVLQGQRYAFIIVIVGLVAAMVTSFAGSPIIGGAMGIVDLVGVAGLFLYSKKPAASKPDSPSDFES